MCLSLKADDFTSVFYNALLWPSGVVLIETIFLEVFFLYITFSFYSFFQGLLNIDFVYRGASLKSAF